MNVLTKLAKLLNNSNIKWSLGGESLLYHYRIVENYEFIDVLVDEDSLLKTINILSEIGKEKEFVDKDIFHTDHYLKYDVNGVTVNVICGMKINNNGHFEYDFNDSDTESYFMLEEVKIPKSYIMDWYIIYSMINDIKMMKRIEEFYSSGNFMNSSRLTNFREALPVYKYKFIEQKVNYIRSINA